MGGPIGGEKEDDTGERKGMPQDRKSLKVLKSKIRDVYTTQECPFHTKRRRWLPLAPRIPTIGGNPRRSGLPGVRWEGRHGKVRQEVNRIEGQWTNISQSIWRGNKKLLQVPKALKLPFYWDIEDEGTAASEPAANETGIKMASGTRRSRDSTSDEAKY